jgi:hypothetical protein
MEESPTCIIGVLSGVVVSHLFAEGTLPNVCWIDPDFGIGPVARDGAVLAQLSQPEGVAGLEGA